MCDVCQRIDNFWNIFNSLTSVLPLWLIVRTLVGVFYPMTLNIVKILCLCSIQIVLLATTQSIEIICKLPKALPFTQKALPKLMIFHVASLEVIKK